MLLFECDICHKQEEYDANSYLHKTIREECLISLCEQCFIDLGQASFDRLINLIKNGNQLVYGTIYLIIKEVSRYEPSKNLNTDFLQSKVQEIFNEMPVKNIHAEIERTIQAIENIFNETEDEKLKKIIQLSKPKYTNEEIIDFLNIYPNIDNQCVIKGCQEDYRQRINIYGEEICLCYEHKEMFEQILFTNPEHLYLTDIMGNIYRNILLDFIFNSYQDENIDFNDQIPF